MAVRNMRLVLGLFFLVAGTAVLAVRFLMPEAAGRIGTPLRMTIGGFLALVLAGVNLAKWYAGWAWYQQQATPVRRPLQRDPNATGGEEQHNPDFDFGKPDKEQSR
jgi:hypothetical protein